MYLFIFKDTVTYNDATHLNIYKIKVNEGKCVNICLNTLAKNRLTKI